MTIAIVGGTGFTGERVVRLLAGRRRSAVVVARESSDTTIARTLGIPVRRAELDDIASLVGAFAECETLVYVASMGFGHVPGVIDAACRAGIRRAIFTSTTALLTRLPVRSRPARIAAEDAVRASPLQWTIVRPTMIYGGARDRNMCRLLRHLLRWRVMPIPGDGSALQQPVHVDDVASALVAASNCNAAIGSVYEISGLRALTFRQLVDAAGVAIGVRARCIPVPLRGAIAMAGIAEHLGLRTGIRAEQLERLAEDKAFSHAAAARDFGFRPRSFEQGIAEEAAELGFAVHSGG
jgi:nucleoside-diphosphate-sugar epimerase